MNIINTRNLTLNSYDGVCLFSTKKTLKSLGENFPAIKDYLCDDIFKGEQNEITTFPIMIEKKKIDVILIGSSEDSSAEELMDAFGLCGKKISSMKLKNVLLYGGLLSEELKEENKFISAIKGVYFGTYSFNKFFTEKKSEEPDTISFYADIDNFEDLLSKSLEICQGVTLAKILADEPSNILKPSNLANIVTKEFENTLIKTDVLNKKQIEALDMKLYLSVGQGSEAEPKLIVMKYKGNPESDEIIGLVGKGITYDSGGYSIKPTDSMITMKSDMGGAAAVIGAMKIIAEQKPKKNITAIVAACENMISGGSYLPGDIITSMNGKTVEIINTDAEGRLTLADAMTYAIRIEKATKVVDICTLTGACVVALGEEFAGIITKEDTLWEKLKDSSIKTLEPCWRLPLNKRIMDKNKSKVADLKNSGGRWAGSSSAGAFVGEFTEDLPWIHIDIAGTAFIEDEKPAHRIGATGFGAHLLSDLVNTL